MFVETEGYEPPEAALYRFRSSSTVILIAVWVAIFNDTFLFGTIIPVLPYALPHRVNINPGDVQIWIAVLLAAYGGALLVGSLIFGWVGDRLPQRRGIFLFGIACLLMATVLLSVGRHLALLILGRFLQGLAAAVVWTTGLALLTDLFGQDRYGEAVGYGQTAVSIGTISAPLLGGVVYARGGYSAVSGMSIGVIAFSLALALIMIEPKRRPPHQQQQKSGSPVQGNKKLSHSATDFVGPDWDSEASTINEPTAGTLDERSTLLPKKLEVNGFSDRPAYHVLLRSGRILADMGGIFNYAFVIISFEALIPLFVKETFHWDSTHAALIFLAWIIPGMLGPVAGKVSDRFGSRWIAIGGFLFAVAPLILMRLVTQNTTSQKGLLCALLTMVGFGVVWVMPACISDLTAAAADLKRERPDDFGKAGASTQAFGLFVFAYSCGTFVGPTVAGIMKAKLDWGSATTILACACVAACIPIGFKTPASSRRKQVNPTGRHAP